MNSCVTPYFNSSNPFSGNLTRASVLAVLALVACLLSAPSSAKAPSFTYVEAEYIATGDFKIAKDDTSASVDLDGFALNASLELGIFFIQASRFELESDDLLGGEIEDNISTAAAGLTFALPQTSLYGLLRVRKDDLTFRGGGFDERDSGTSIGAEAGVRFNLTNRLELNANVGIPDIGEGKSYGIGAQFFVLDNVGLNLKFSSIEVEDDEVTGQFDTTSLGLRISF